MKDKIKGYEKIVPSVEQFTFEEKEAIKLQDEILKKFQDECPDSAFATSHFIAGINSGRSMLYDSRSMSLAELKIRHNEEKEKDKKCLECIDLRTSKCSGCSFNEGRIATPFWLKIRKGRERKPHLQDIADEVDTIMSNHRKKLESHTLSLTQGLYDSIKENQDSMEKRIAIEHSVIKNSLVVIFVFLLFVLYKLW